MGFNTKASAALVFLILYAILFALLILGSLTGRLKLCSRYGLILFHVTIRLASQATELAFEVVRYGNTSFLVACFVLGAAAYYILILCTYCFLISWKNHNPASDSCPEPRSASGTPWYKRLISSFTIVGSGNRLPTPGMYLFMIANTTFITGGCLLTRDNNVEQRNTPAAKALRTTGLAILLTITMLLFYSIIDTILQSRRENPDKRTHPTLLLLLAACPLLFVRGLYGVMSGILPAFNYFNPHNYGETGFTSSFVISDSIMGTTMEWCCCTLLMLTYFTSLNDPRMADLEVYSEGDKDQSGRAVKA